MLNADRVRYFAQKPVPVNDGILMKGPQRERGMWSFLTWSFFLSQLAVGNAFAGGSAQAAATFDPNPLGSADASATNATSASGTPDLGAGASEDPQPANLPGATAQLHAGPSAAGPNPGAIEQIHLTGEATSAAPSFATQGDAAVDGGTVEPDVPPSSISPP